MNESIKWAELSDEEKVRLILEHVLKLQVVESAMDSRLPVWPVAWYDEDGYWIVIGQKGASEERFDPLRDMNDAWKVVTHMDDVTISVTHSPPIDYEHDPKRAEYVSCEIWYGNPYSPSFRAFAPSAPQAICIAALRKEGIQVTNVMEALPAYQVTWEDGSAIVLRTREEAEQEYKSREQYLKDRLRWAKDVRKLKLEEFQVPEDYFNGIEWA